MNKIPQNPAVLLLEDGRFFYGKAAGAIGTTIGKITYHTGMTGHQKTLTDPANKNAIMVMTTTHVGNIGIQEEELENENISLAGLVVKSFSEYDNRSTGGISLHKFLLQQNKVAIRNIDTRAVVRHLRKNGPMAAVISSEETDLARLKGFLDQKKNESELKEFTQPAHSLTGNKDSKKRIAIVDLGIKNAVLKHLLDRDCQVKLFSPQEEFDDMKNWNPDGYLISHGPVHQEFIRDLAPLIQEIINSNKPVLALGHGYLSIAHALGIQINPDKVIHNGLNHSVKNLISGKAEITSQNFAFIASASDLLSHEEIQVTHQNINDDTIVGFKLKNKPVFAILYNPDASPGPHDSFYQFDYFIQQIKN